MKRHDKIIQREFKREMNEHHGGLIVGALVLIALALVLVGHPELGICIYVGMGVWISLVFKRIARRVWSAEKGG